MGEMSHDVLWSRPYAPFAVTAWATSQAMERATSASSAGVDISAVWAGAAESKGTRVWAAGARPRAILVMMALLCRQCACAGGPEDRDLTLVTGKHTGAGISILSSPRPGWSLGHKGCPQVVVVQGSAVSWGWGMLRSECQKGCRPPPNRSNDKLIP